MSSRSITIYVPSQGNRLARSQILAVKSYSDIRVVVIPHQILGRGVLGTVGMLLRCRAIYQSAATMLPQFNS
jgi:hypothetical protein